MRQVFLYEGVGLIGWFTLCSIGGVYEVASVFLGSLVRVGELSESWFENYGGCGGAGCCVFKVEGGKSLLDCGLFVIYQEKGKIYWCGRCSLWGGLNLW